MNKTLLAFFLFCLPARSLLAWYAYIIREKRRKNYISVNYICNCNKLVIYV